MSFKNVAIVGASGNLGVAVVQELLAAGFHVTALTRQSSSSNFPAGVDVKKVDYDSLESLQSALAGQDAVVSTVATVAIGSQKILADAALAAGVRRFVPSEFGVNTRHLAGTAIGKILAGKTAFVDYLDELAQKKTSFSWTGVSTGLFFDWGIQRNTILNHKDKTITIVDSGNEKWPASTLAHIGRVVAGILQHPEATANKYLDTSSFAISLNEVRALAEELTGASYAVDQRSGAELQKTGEEKLAAGDYSAFVPLLQAHLYADGAGRASRSDNELVGVAEEDPRAVVKEVLEGVGAV